MTDIDLNRRQLLKGMAAVTGGAMLNPSLANSAAVQNGDIDWESIRAAFPVQQPFLNLDNGCIGPPTFKVQDAVVDGYKFSNQNPCYNMFEVIDLSAPEIKKKLAAIADCDPMEIALNRCTTVGMSTAILGMPMKRGDEVLLSNWDYPSMINAWKQRADRDGIVIRPVDFGVMDSDEEIVAAYEREITPKTRAIQLTHILHWTGRAIPVAEICAIARPKDIRTVVDGAQSFAHIPMSFRKMGCDYFATSFHKWLSGPIGTGMLIVREDRIDETWPLFPIYEELPGADKFGMSNLGTYNSASHYALGDAADFHNAIGTERKQRRLQSLTRYWVDRAMDIPGFRLHTPIDHPSLGGIATFSLDGLPIEVIESRLRDEFKIQTRKRDPKGMRGVRVSPQVYMRESELDTFVDAVRQLANSA